MRVFFKMLSYLIIQEKTIQFQEKIDTMKERGRKLTLWVQSRHFHVLYYSFFGLLASSTYRWKNPACTYFTKMYNSRFPLVLDEI